MASHRPPRPTGPARPQTRPFAPGQVIGTVPVGAVKGPALTPLEQQVLDKAGYTGGPIPDLSGTGLSKDLRAQVDQVRQAANQLDGLTPVPPDTPPIVPGPYVNFDQLSVARQAEISKAVADARAMLSQDNVPGPLMSIPGMEAAWATANEPVTLVDDRKATPAESSAPWLDQPLPQESTPRVESPAGTVPDVTICQRCGHASTTPVPEITPADKHQYRELVLGGPRFCKTYDLHDGLIQVSFRSLLPRETNLILDQLTYDCSAKRILYPAQYYRKLFDYRLMISISQLVLGDKPPLNFKPLADVAHTPTDTEPTPLVRMYEYFDNEIFTSERLQRIIGDHFRQFELILETLEARADDPDFLKAIG